MIPLELITMLGSGLLTGVLSLWSQSIKSRQAQHEMMMGAMAAQTGAFKEAREFKGSKSFSFTRRTIALTAVFAIVLLPKMVAILEPSIDVTVGWTEWNPGFLFFEGSNDVEWKTAKGMVITPLDTHLMSGIAGMYFGASTVKNS